MEIDGHDETTGEEIDRDHDDITGARQEAFCN